MLPVKTPQRPSRTSDTVTRPVRSSRVSKSAPSSAWYALLCSGFFSSPHIGGIILLTLLSLSLSLSLVTLPQPPLLQPPPHPLPQATLLASESASTLSSWSVLLSPMVSTSTWPPSKHSSRHRRNIIPVCLLRSNKRHDPLLLKTTYDQSPCPIYDPFFSWS